MPSNGIFDDVRKSNKCVWNEVDGKDIKIIISENENEWLNKSGLESKSENAAVGSSGDMTGVDRGSNDDNNKNSSDETNSVWAHSSVMRDASKVWATMLDGDSWRESRNNVVTVSGVSLDGLRAMVHYMYGCTCAALTHLPLRTCVQLLLACDMYGLPHVRRFAARQIILSCCSGEEIVHVFSSGVGRVEEDIITTLLVHLVTDNTIHTWRRARWLHSIAESEHSGDLLHNLYTILYSALENNTMCNCDTKQHAYMASNNEYDKLI